MRIELGIFFICFIIGSFIGAFLAGTFHAESGGWWVILGGSLIYSLSIAGRIFYYKKTEVAISKLREGALLIISAFLMVFFIGVGFAALDGMVLYIEKLSVEQKKFVGHETQTTQREFLRFACKAKSVCKDYSDIKQGCASAGSIQKCIDIRMKGEDTSMCLDNGEVVGLNANTMPGFVQCGAYHVSGFLGELKNKFFQVGETLSRKK